MKTLEAIKARLDSQLANLERCLKDEVFTLEQQMLSTERNNLSLTNQLLEQLIQNNSSNNLSLIQTYKDKKTNQIVEMSSLKTSIDKSKMAIDAHLCSLDKQLFNDLSLTYITPQLIKSSVSSLKYLCTRTILENPIIYDTTALAKIPGDIQEYIQNCQFLEKATNYLLEYRIGFLLTTDVNKIKKTINRCVFRTGRPSGNHKDYNAQDEKITDTENKTTDPVEIFVMALVIGDAIAINDLLNIVEPEQRDMLTNHFNEFKDYYCDDFPDQPGKPLAKEQHPFYARILWLLSKNYHEEDPEDLIEEISYWDFYIENRNGSLLWPMGLTTFHLLFLRKTNSLSVKKLLLCLAFIYDNIEVIKYFCEKDEHKDEFIKLIKFERLGEIAAEFHNLAALEYSMEHNFLDQDEIDRLPKCSIPKFIINYCHNSKANASNYQVNHSIEGELWEMMDGEESNLQACVIRAQQRRTFTPMVIAHKNHQLKDLNCSLQEKDKKITEQENEIKKLHDEIAQLKATAHQALSSSNKRPPEDGPPQDEIISEINKFPRTEEPLNISSPGQDKKPVFSSSQVLFPLSSKETNNSIASLVRNPEHISAQHNELGSLAFR